MPTFVVVLSLVFATVALGVVAGGGIALASVLAIIAVAAGFALSGASEDSFAASR